MKHKKLFGLQLLLCIALILAVSGCTKQKDELTDTQTLVVERQTTQLSNYISSSSYYCNADFAIDIPLYGPQPLMDSLKVFLNKKLLETFSWVIIPNSFPNKEIYHNNLAGMLSYYKNKFKPYQGSICNNYSYSLFLIAQTESFITYGLELFSCGANCASTFHSYTFSKKDGHLCEIIDLDNLTRYIKKHYPKYSTYEDTISHYFSLGLLKDGLLIAEQFASNNHYVANRVENQEILQYLSKDALELFTSQGSTDFSFEDWSLGYQIGKVETIDGDSAILMQRVSWWGFIDSENDDLYNENHADEEHPEVTAYRIKNDRYVPSKIVPKHRIVIAKSKDYLINLDIDLDNDQARYSSWKHSNSTTDEPDLIIDAPHCDFLGHGVQVDLGYSFENNGYIYEIWTDPYPEGPQLKVYQGTKLLLKQKIQILYSNEDL